MIAEVQLTNREEFGVEIGLQSPVLFARSSAGTSPGVPGFNFNTTALAPNAPVGSPGLPNTTIVNSGDRRVPGAGQPRGRPGRGQRGRRVRLLGRQRHGQPADPGAQPQGRIDVLSRPQLVLTDNQTGFFQVGQRVPAADRGTIITGVGTTQQGIEYLDDRHRPAGDPADQPGRQGADAGRAADLRPEPDPVNLGDGLLATAFDIQTVQTTVLAGDGETVLLGGLIRKSDSQAGEQDPGAGRPAVGRGRVPLPHPGPPAAGADLHHDPAHHPQRGGLRPGDGGGDARRSAPTGRTRPASTGRGSTRCSASRTRPRRSSAPAWSARRPAR